MGVSVKFTKKQAKKKFHCSTIHESEKQKQPKYASKVVQHFMEYFIGVKMNAMSLHVQIWKYLQYTAEKKVGEKLQNSVLKKENRLLISKYRSQDHQAPNHHELSEAPSYTKMGGGENEH